MLKVGSKFYTFDELSSRLEEFQDLEQVQLWVRDSRTVVAAAKRARRKSLNPALKYAELTYSCVFGGRRPSDQTKIHNQTSAGGCPFKVRLSTSIDGQALVVKEICHEHNHEPGKKLHEEPRRLYKKTQNRTTVRKPVRYIVNKQRVSSGTCKSKSRLDHTESHVQLGQSPFHHLQLHQQQYQQQQQLKLQLQQHLQQQQQQQQQLHEKEAEVIQLDSPDHVDTPEHLSSPDLSTTFDQLGSLNNSVDQYTYLPPSPISPSLSSGCPVDCEEEERLEPILDLEEALEEALGDLDSVGSMEVDANLRLTSSGSTSSSLVSQSETSATDDPTGPPPAKRQRGRPRKQSFTGTPLKNEKSEAGKSGETKEDKSSDEEEEFLGFSPSTDKVLSGLQVTNKSDIMVSRADILQASAMARQLHVYKPGIDFVPGARLEVLESRDNNWYQCKIVEVDWGELDILVHYERWSNRFDEWLKMDSTRIRSLSRTSQRRERKNSAYSVGDRVLARWSADGKRYQARVTKELGDDQFEVLFFDGVAKVLRSTALAKVDSKVGEIEEQRGTPSKQHVTDDEDSLLSPGATSASSTDSRSSTPDPDQSPAVPGRVEELMEVETVTPVRKNIFDVEIIEQKRKSKRKAAVEELFQSLKKRRKYEHQSQGKAPTSSPRHQQQQPMQQEQQKQQQQPQQQIRSTQSRKTSFSKKKGREAATETQEDTAPHQAEAATSEAPDSPVLAPRIVSIDMSDGWKKCCSQRTHGTTAGKWDTFYLAPDGKKIRSKNDLYRYCEEFKLACDIEKFDFSVKNMREVIDGQTDTRSNVKTNEEQKESEKGPSTSEVKESEAKFPAQELSGIAKTVPGKKPDLKKSEIRQTDVSKHSESPRMKLEIPIIPKTEHIGTLPPSLLGASAAPWSPTMPSSLPRSLPASASTPSGELMGKDPVGVSGYTSTEPTPEAMRPSAAPIRQRHVLKKEPVLAPNEFIVHTEHNDHQCSKGGCGKSFRKENLLQMHIKHYHPELLKKTSSWAPNVADLAYARTVGDHLDTGSSPTHASPPVEKIGKSEIGSKKAPRGLSSVSSPDVRSKVVDKKTSGSIKTITGSKDSKKRDKSKLESEQGPPPISEDEIESKEEVEDLADDTEVESPISTLGLQSEDPDYVPSEGEILLMRKDRKEKRKTRGESKGKKKKIVASESVCEDDQQETKTVTKYRYCKHKGFTSSKASVSSANAELPLPEPSSVSPSKKIPGPEVEAPSIEPEEDTGDAWAESTEGVPTSETSAEIINCGCGSTEEEGLMLQCDVCLCWQHGDCYNIVGEDQVPDKYICSLCDHPRLERSSHKFRHHQDWLKEGRLPRFSFSSSRGDLRLEACVRRGHELTANVQQLSQILHSLRLKLHIAREADHPKFVMWHKKWNEQEESPPHGKEKLYTTPAAIAPLQDLMDIVDQEDPPLGTNVTDSKVPDLSHQTANLSSDITLEKTEAEELGERLGTSPTVLSETWNQGTTDEGQEVMRSQMILADSNKVTVNDKNESENSIIVDAEKVVGSSSEVSERKVPENSEEDKHSEGSYNVDDNIQQNEDKPKTSTLSEEEPPIPEIKSPKESESSLNTVELSMDKKDLQDSLQIRDEEISMNKETENADNSVKMSCEENDSVIRGESTPEDIAGDKEKVKCESSDEHSIPTHDADHPEECKCEEMEVENVEGKGESKTDIVLESEATVNNEEKSKECSFENKMEIKSSCDEKDESQVKEPKLEASEEHKSIHEKDETKSEYANIDNLGLQGVTADNIVKEETDLPQISLKVERESDILKTESEEKTEDNKLKDQEEQEKSPDSSSLGTSGVSHSAAEDPLNEEEPHLEDGDDLTLDLGGLGVTGEGGMPGGNELAALLSSQTELEQLVSQASSALAPVSSNVHSVQAPIIPEAERIEPVNCKLNLLEHVQAVQSSIIQRFDEIEQQLEVLEAEMGLAADATEEEAEEDLEDRDPATLQARALIKLVMNDLSIVKKIADFTH